MVRSLAAYDDKIELNRRMNETLEAMARAVFRDWFVDFGPTRRKAAMSGKGGGSDPVAILGGLIPDPAKAAPLAELFPDRFGEDGLPEGWRSAPVTTLCRFSIVSGFRCLRGSERKGSETYPIMVLPASWGLLTKRSLMKCCFLLEKMGRWSALMALLLLNTSGGDHGLITMPMY